MEQIEHPGVAAFVADIMFREGSKSATGMIHKALNETLGPDAVKNDAKFRPDDVLVLNSLTLEEKRMFADYLGAARAQKYYGKDVYEGEKRRAEHFRDLAKDGN